MEMTTPLCVHGRDVLPGERLGFKLAAAAQVHLATKTANDIDVLVQGHHAMIRAWS